MYSLPLIEIYSFFFFFGIVMSIAIDLYHKKTRRFGENEGKR